jgi:hypothetical protein
MYVQMGKNLYVMMVSGVEMDKLCHVGLDIIVPTEECIHVRYNITVHTGHPNHSSAMIQKYVHNPVHTPHQRKPKYLYMFLLSLF